MNRRERIIAILTEALAPTALDVRDDSAQHHGHTGSRPEGETHYTVTIISPHFQGLRRVQCHQLIYKLLDKELKTGLHALSIVAKEQ